MPNSIKIIVYHARQCDPKKCTALKLKRHGLIRLVTSMKLIPRRSIVLNPFAEIAFSPADRDRIKNFGLAALDFSWEHVEKPLKHVRGTSQPTFPSGGLILSCPPYFKFENLSLGYRKYKWWGNDYPPHHINRFKPWTLFYGLKLAGFKEVVIFTEPLLPGTVLEGINPKETLVYVEKEKQLILPRPLTISIILENLRSLYTNARFLGNFQYAIGVKGESNLNWEKILSTAISLSAADIMWGDDKR